MATDETNKMDSNAGLLHHYPTASHGHVKH
jgi:hypothetical protein